ncbi:MAG: flagellar motor protein [Novosphingobium sp. 28-62-57]|uniref:flagellar motor protein MotB n=1 Tax=unclassified Novosphingobium TaxID=2644732 RepID=UPI000BC627E6|nr:MULTISPECIES: flagellar motor protein MotB [unclassified Novosphingobium]OYW47579.1 MAG: flagellar motor protein [Novosphingobium sp. 12-63-9]OYZ08810.1 MAG: flagellar motor protein [Novosphingobium sp. 28-62-57]OZA37665.1 MAG: flagellar motor protein [Novosphingobium sp. 17-62-9]
MAKAPAKGKNEPPKPIIVKKITIVAGGHHGGAWKVAYADFVTAMMAFFLLMWLLGATTEKQRKGIADYFTPTLVKTKQGSAGGNGLLGGSSLTEVDKYPHRAGQTGTQSLTIPRDATGGPKEGGSKERRAQAVKERIAKKLAQSEKLRKLARQVRMTETPEGVRLDLVDDADFSMFLLGTTVLTPDAAELLRAIGQAIAPDPSQITVRGHTDSLPWKNGVANNWSLSAGRAESTRQALMRQGIAEPRFRRIEGVADREPLIQADPADPRNRRMSILLIG